MENHSIILFDGDCLFCNHSVRFIIKHDQKHYFKFAKLDGKVGKELLHQYLIPNDLDSLILIQKGKYYTASTAALRIGQSLSGVYKLAAIFLLVPRPIRDRIYFFFARKRHQLTRQDACMLPNQKERKRYLD